MRASHRGSARQRRVQLAARPIRIGIDRIELGFDSTQQAKIVGTNPLRKISDLKTGKSTRGPRCRGHGRPFGLSFCRARQFASRVEQGTALARGERTGSRRRGRWMGCGEAASELGQSAAVTETPTSLRITRKLRNEPTAVSWRQRIWRDRRIRWRVPLDRKFTGFGRIRGSGRGKQPAILVLLQRLRFHQS